MSAAGIQFRCLASTRVCEEELGREVNCEEELSREVKDGEEVDTEGKTASPKSDQRHVACIQNAQLSPDGTCIFTSDADRKFSVYAVAVDGLDNAAAKSLTPYAQFQSADPIWAFAANPRFNCRDSTTTTVLVSRRGQYISLHNTLWNKSQFYSDEAEFLQTYKQTESPVDISTKIEHYKLVSSTTEAVTGPLSLAYSRPGTSFYAGHRNSIAVFDIENRSGPIRTIKTIPSTSNKLKGGGVGFKGDIAALSVSPLDGTIAAGSRTRYVGLYDHRAKEQVTSFGLPGMLYEKKTHDPALEPMAGDGVTHMKWSPDGTYLYIAERKSDALLMYDVRNFSFALGYCAGRAALTNQTLGFDVWGSWGGCVENQKHEIWAGGTDGRVRVWRDPYMAEGAVEPDEVLDVSGGEPDGGSVVASLVHKDGNLATIARGGRELRCGAESTGRGMRRGVREWGSLDILGLASNATTNENMAG
ncbi:hypothetical protein P280DRAFT_88409 [Massarina eburnea CBS 473.64]|uniref:WD40 repeat-like protein n=1 Tax=Massarina eburnea CBS 473.64 TaxID=1395130 RepID=A0A6A6RRQ6_9PLEO|nr:hypothetical protein P280DRAFT_88409 [Massarina eburnea CBS 473.64]